MKRLKTEIGGGHDLNEDAARVLINPRSISIKTSCRLLAAIHSHFLSVKCDFPAGEQPVGKRMH